MHMQLHSRMTALRSLAAVGSIALFLAAQSVAAQENTDAFVESQFAAMPAQTETAQPAAPREFESGENTTAGANPPLCAFASTEFELEGCIPPLGEDE